MGFFVEDDHKEHDHDASKAISLGPSKDDEEAQSDSAGAQTVFAIV